MDILEQLDIDLELFEWHEQELGDVVGRRGWCGQGRKEYRGHLVERRLEKLG